MTAYFVQRVSDWLLRNPVCGPSSTALRVGHTRLWEGRWLFLPCFPSSLGPRERFFRC